MIHYIETQPCLLTERGGGVLLHYLINHIETPPRLLTAQGGGGGENSLHGTM